MSDAHVLVNGRRTPIGDVPVHTTALDWLRGLGLTGAKEGCAEGECGTCSVLVARPGIAAATEWVALNTCLTPVAALDGQELVTVEGLGTPDQLHPVQRELAVRGGSQCGYCTPGFVCSMAAEFYRPGRTAFDPHALSGNLCRCTGYRPIADAAAALAEPGADDALAARAESPPPEPQPTRLTHDGCTFVRPSTLAEALELLRQRPESTVVAGCTDWGVDVNLRGARAASVVAVDQLPELRELRIEPDVVELGAALTLTELERRLDGVLPLLDEVLPLFGSRLVRNAATIGGNLGTGSPIGDLAPALLALDATVVLSSLDGEREVPLDGYFTGYRESVRRPGELIRAVRIPRPVAPLVGFHKIAKRRFDDISSVAVAFAVRLDDGLVSTVHIGLGGVAATPIRASRTEQALRGQPWTAETVRAAAEVLRGEGTPLDDHRASAAYRSAMLEQSLLKFHTENQASEVLA